MDIIDMFSKEIELEKIVAQALDELIQCEDFHTIDAFRFFDTEEKGVVDSYQIKKGLEKAKIACDVDSICLFLARFDRDLDQSLRYSEFCEAFLQRDDEKMRQIAKRVPRNVHNQFTYNEMFQAATRRAYANCWQAYFNAERETEKLRQELMKNPFTDIQQAFSIFDRDQKGFFTVQDLKHAFERNGLKFREDECKLVFYKFNGLA